MNQVIEILNDDHIGLREQLDRLEDLATGRQPLEHSVVLEKMQRFMLSMKLHHRREDEVLYQWMKAQNPNSDVQLMSSLDHEHKNFSHLVDEMIDLEQRNDTNIKRILFDFVNAYRTHMEKEESFIYKIAEALTKNENDGKRLLKKMTQVEHGK